LPKSKASPKRARRKQIAKARAAGELVEVQALEKQLASERRRIQEDAEGKKERVRRCD